MSESNEKRIILLLCDKYLQDPSSHSIIKITLERIAKNTGFLSVGDFMKDHLLYLLKNWFLDSKEISMFPYSLCGYFNLVDFLKENVSIIIPLCSFLRKKGVIELIAEKLKTTERQLVLFVPSIFLQISKHQLLYNRQQQVQLECSLCFLLALLSYWRGTFKNGGSKADLLLCSFIW